MDNLSKKTRNKELFYNFQDLLYSEEYIYSFFFTNILTNILKKIFFTYIYFFLSLESHESLYTF